MHRGETRCITGVYDLFGGRGIEPGGRLDREDQNGVAGEREFQGAGGIADGDDGFVGAGRQAEANASAGLIYNPDFLIFHRDRIRGADAHAGKTRDAQLRVDSEIHASSGRALETLVFSPEGPG